MAGKDAVQFKSLEAEREAFSEAFPGVVAPGTVPLDDRGFPMADKAVRNTSGMSDEHKRFLSRVDSNRQQLAIMGVQPVTILNFNPYACQINNIQLQQVVLPPCPVGKKYSITVVRMINNGTRAFMDSPDCPDAGWFVDDLSVEQTDDGGTIPKIWVPIQLAREFEREFRDNGGVMVYVGDGLKENPEVTAEKDKKLAHNMGVAKSAMLRYAKARIQNANNEWNTPNRVGARNITDIDRKLALILHDTTGQELPPWIEKTPGQYGLGTQCPRCKATPQSGAYMCPSCAFVLDPREAFEQGDIGIEDTALTRLDRKTLKEMGISELIDETVVERNLALKKKAAQIRKDEATAK